MVTQHERATAVSDSETCSNYLEVKIHDALVNRMTGKAPPEVRLEASLVNLMSVLPREEFLDEDGFVRWTSTPFVAASARELGEAFRCRQQEETNAAPASNLQSHRRSTTAMETLRHRVPNEAPTDI